MLLMWMLCAMAAIASAEDCVMSEWGDWTEWTKLDCGEEPSGAAPPTLGTNHQHIQTPSVKEEGRVLCANGFADPYACYNIDQMGMFDFNDLCGQNDCGHVNDLEGRDVYGWHFENPSDPTSHVDYAIMTSNWGTSFVRMTGEQEFFNADVVAWMEGELDVSAGNRDVVVVGNYAYISANVSNHGIQIVDLTMIAGLEPPLNIVGPTAVYNDVGIVQNLVTSPDSNVLYAAGADEGTNTCSGGLYAMNVSNPLSPAYLGCFGDAGIINDADCNTYDGRDEDYSDNRTTNTEICYAFNGSAMVIINADNKADMQLISATGYIGNLFASQGAVERRDIMVISGDTQDELHWVDNVGRRTRSMIWDILDLDAPFVDFYYTADHEGIDAKHIVQNDWVYLPNYEAGLRILRVDQTTETMTELGFFDLCIDEQQDGFVDFVGANGVYTGFVTAIDDGVLPVSTVDDGLFMLRADTANMHRMVEEGLQRSERYRYRTILSTDHLDSCPSTVEIQTRTVPVTCQN